jgi:single-stranded-DNA-specific exonuclease
MKNFSKKWEVIGKLENRSQKINTENIIKALLANRGIKTKRQKEEFIKPTLPEKIKLQSLRIKEIAIKKTISRLKKAIKDKEKVIIYGDYDADGVCATAILWEALYKVGVDVLPYIPGRFSEGYGLNSESIKALKEKYPNLKVIISVDNGIVANEEVDYSNKLGIDVIVTDHHQIGKKLPKAFAIIHTVETSGSAIAWLIAREFLSSLRSKVHNLQPSLDLVAIGTIADQLPLIGYNRSFAKYGLLALNQTKRPGLLALFTEAAILPDAIGPYEVGFIIAPRINATGRLEHAIDSLRLLCTKDRKRAEELANHIGKVNSERQKTVEKVTLHAKNLAKDILSKKVLVLAHESYHEGVIGLAASRLVEEFYRPAIVISKGEKFSKASARSIPGFNIIESIRKLDSMLVDAGGHPMAAGFTISTTDIQVFAQKFEEVSVPFLTDEILTKKLKIDMELSFENLNWELLEKMKSFEPTGLGNPTPVFLTKKAKILQARVVGRQGNHLKLKLEEAGISFDAIAFGLGSLYPSLNPDTKLDIVYSIEENIWNGQKSLQLKIRDVLLN